MEASKSQLLLLLIMTKYKYLCDHQSIKSLTNRITFVKTALT